MNNFLTLFSIFLISSIAFASKTNASETIDVYLTGYSYWDNSPKKSNIIARPGLRTKYDGANGTGSYEDPITIAVGWKDSVWYYDPGTIMYVHSLKKYVIVEDLCGACKKNTKRLDIWIGGKSHTASDSRNCTYSITGDTKITINPPKDLEVIAGPVIETHC